jgi:prepilin peptidase CpaA
MNLIGLAPQWAVISLAALLVLAALQDAIQLKISNFICGGILVLGVATLFLVGPRMQVWQNLALLAAALTIGTMLFSAGKMGGGDVKLFAATAFWFNLGSALWLLVSVTIAGGILAILIIGARMVDWSDALQRRAIILRPKSGIPYGIAIAAGALLTMSSLASTQPVDPRTNWRAVTAQAR